jgi:acyl-CoA thioesterase
MSDALAIARAAAERMWADDPASRGLGMALDDIAPGTATLSMLVGPNMVNGHGMCHGGFIFTLADSAFAFACNSHNQRAVAQHAAISFVAPAKEGDRLIAVAVERQRRGRSGIYDVTVTTGTGLAIAEFRGHSRIIEGHLVPPG